VELRINTHRSLDEKRFNDSFRGDQKREPVERLLYISLFVHGICVFQHCSVLLIVIICEATWDAFEFFEDIS